MPELPEAETIARQLRPRLLGRRFTRIIHLRGDILRYGVNRSPGWLCNSPIAEVDRRGKRPIIHLPSNRGIIFYLGMTGYLGVHKSSDPVIAHTHVRIALDGTARDGSTEELRFRDARRFGGLSFFEQTNGDTPPGLHDLGIEPLEMKAAQFRRLLARKRQIKALLMDQRTVAGLGNIYCDEALFAARIHPLTRADELTGNDAARLGRAIKRVLRAAIKHEGTTIINYTHPDGPGQFQDRLKVYGHTGKPCRRCRTPIEHLLAGGRSTHVCPQCQPASCSD